MTLDVKIIVYVDVPNTKEQANHVKVFSELGYAPLADSLHRYDYNYLYKNGLNARFFIQEDEELYMFDREDLLIDMTVVPDFVIVFNENKEVCKEDWSRIHQYVKEHITDTMVDMTNTMKVHELMGKPVEMKSEQLTEVIESTRGNNYYNLETRLLEHLDIMLYEVRKPFTDLPYTSVTRNYSKKSHLPFFTDLFICQSWGVARSDISFLQHTWKELNMEGVFDLEALMKEATDKCLPSDNRIPEPEPEVYRRELNDVITILAEKKSRSVKAIPDFIKNKN
jgi:hypothetical protein